jgi:hypothetical protein
VNFRCSVLSGFVAFSTIGYGDIGPRTGPGRVCFVVWSLLGVGTMTVLISVVSEAYQSRYSTVVQNGLFEKAMRKYQNKPQSIKQESHPDIPTYDREAMTVEELRNALNDTKVEIAKLPLEIIAQADVFHTHLQDALSHKSSEKPSPGLQKVLEEMMDEGEMNDELRKEVLQNEEARRNMFMIYFDRTLKRMVEHTERMSKLIEVRNALEESGEAEGVGLSSKNDGLKLSTRNHTNWLKPRAGVFISSSPRQTHRKDMPYLHQGGIQSAPHLALDESSEDNIVDYDGGGGDKAKIPTHEKGKVQCV